MANAMLACDFFEGVVMKRADSIYPVQLRSATEECRGDLLYSPGSDLGKSGIRFRFAVSSARYSPWQPVRNGNVPLPGAQYVSRGVRSGLADFTAQFAPWFLASLL